MEKRDSVYIPGDLTELKLRHPSHYDLVHNKFQQHIENNKPNGYPKQKEDFSAPICNNNQPDLKSEVNEMIQQQKIKKFSHTTRKEKEKGESPYKAAASNFILAKKLAKENLEHEPLPDTIADAMYRKRQIHGDLTPGLVLKDGNYATGIGWKGYPGYGATRCTKMKIFRPKTCIPKISKDNSVSSFDKKWRFIRQQKVTPIDLAICWDMTPINPSDEPKRTTHIDGSNGSQAPAVFTLVHTPKDDMKNEADESEVETQKHKKNIVKCEKEYSSKSSDTSSQNNLKRAKSAFNVEGSHESSSQSSKVVNKLHQSTPDLTDSGSHKYCSQECYKERNINRRLCVACEMKNVKLKERPKSEYKMAFKAGVPNNKCVSSNRTPMYLKVPKQREPYPRKNYAIKSLAPPFSLQREKSQDYPDHWRLATVYQHSYKPIHLRKKPLILSVFQ